MATNLVDISQFDCLHERGFCWSIGRTRLGTECRVWPRNGMHNWPIIIRVHTDIQTAIEFTLEALGDKSPMRKKHD